MSDKIKTPVYDSSSEDEFVAAAVSAAWGSDVPRLPEPGEVFPISHNQCGIICKPTSDFVEVDGNVNRNFYDTQAEHDKLNMTEMAKDMEETE